MPSLRENSNREYPPVIVVKMTKQKTLDLVLRYTQERKAEKLLEELE